MSEDIKTIYGYNQHFEGIRTLKVVSEYILDVAQDGEVLLSPDIPLLGMWYIDLEAATISFEREIHLEIKWREKEISKLNEVLDEINFNTGK